MKTNTIRILIVEDDLDFCYLIKNTLSTLDGFSVLG